MNHDCELNVGPSSAAYRPCDKPAVTWVRGDAEEAPFYLCAEHYDAVVERFPELDGTI